MRSSRKRHILPTLSPFLSSSFPHTPYPPPPLFSPRQLPVKHNKKNLHPQIPTSSSTNSWLITSSSKPTTCCSTMTAALLAGRAAVAGRRSSCKCIGFWGTLG